MKFGDVEFERRVFPRFTLKLPISYQLEKKKKGLGESANASEGGLMIIVNEPVTIGDQLRINIQLANAEAPETIEVVGKVIWTKLWSEPGQKERYRAGLAFEEISPRALSSLKQFQALWLEQGL